MDAFDITSKRVSLGEEEGWSGPAAAVRWQGAALGKAGLGPAGGGAALGVLESVR